MSTMKLTDVNPVKYMELEFVPGEIKLLRGPNNSGKSCTLRAISRALGGDDKISQRHDAGKPGRIEFGDLTLTVGASTRKKGQTECLGLAGRFDVSELIDPPQKTADLADAHRTKVLCRLTGVEADLNTYEQLHSCLITDDLRNETDAVDLANAVKRLFESSRRYAEKNADQHRGEAKAAKEAVGDTDLAAECDSEKLQAELQEAMTAKTRLEEQAKAARENNERVCQAQKDLGEIESTYKGPTVEEAHQLRSASDDKVGDSLSRLANAQQALRVAEESRRQADAELSQNNQRLEVAVSHAASLAVCKDHVAKGETPEPTGIELHDTTERVAEAREAVEQGAIIRKAREHNAAYITAHDAELGAKKEAAHWEEAAAAVWPTLAKMLDVEGMELRDGRWYIDVDGREQLFHDQSDGFRTTAAIDLLATTARKAEPDRPIIAVLQQPNWEALDEDNRKKVAQKVHDTDISLVTAEADHVWPDGERTELRAETFEGG